MPMTLKDLREIDPSAEAFKFEDGKNYLVVLSKDYVHPQMAERVLALLPRGCAVLMIAGDPRHAVAVTEKGNQ